jgi:hypothetical protein
MCSIKYALTEDPHITLEFPSAESKDIASLVNGLGQDIDMLLVRCLEGTLIVTRADRNRCRVSYERNPYQDLRLPEGWSSGVLIDERYRDSNEKIETYQGAVSPLYQTVDKEAALRTVQLFISSREFPSGMTWLQR